ncbi:MAG: hypothetical protein ACI9S8_002201 [Chlamydiales bacterium]|jgi:hypothetical protein
MSDFESFFIIEHRSQLSILGQVEELGAIQKCGKSVQGQHFVILINDLGPLLKLATTIFL